MNEDLFITSNYFASISDVIYSDRKELKEETIHNNEELIEISSNPNFRYITTKKIRFRIKSNDVIFCNNDVLDNLFFHLKRESKLENITLITHQTDKLIRKKDFINKPNCIKKWFSVNVGFEHEDLVPIPIGIASDFSKKNLNVTDFKFFDKKNFQKKAVSLYLNFQTNTNVSERKHIYEYFSNKDWAIIDHPNLDKQIYFENLKHSTFVLCPWGNGVDTHRFWETLYSGSIPITKKHVTYNYDKKLPVLFVDKYENITYELLESFVRDFNISNYDLEVLSKNYWKAKIKQNHNEKQDFVNIYEKKIVTYYFKVKRNTKKLLNSQFKKIKTVINKITSKLGL